MDEDAENTKHCNPTLPKLIDELGGNTLLSHHDEVDKHEPSLLVSQEYLAFSVAPEALETREEQEQEEQKQKEEEKKPFFIHICENKSQ